MKPFSKFVKDNAWTLQRLVPLNHYSIALQNATACPIVAADTPSVTPPTSLGIASRITVVAPMGLNEEDDIQPMPRILIVDDDDAYRSIITEHLSSIYQISDTASPEEALVMAVEEEPDLILLDLSMPRISGFELCQTLSSLSFTHKIPIFIISGQDERNKAFCQNLGATRYFTKPVDFVALKRTIEWVFNTKKLERRRDLRVQLKIPLTLKGKSKDGSDFEARVTTEDVSKSGFLCVGDFSLENTTTVEVFLFGNLDHRLGDARLVRVVKTDASNLRYGFQLTGLWTTPLIATPM